MKVEVKIRSNDNTVFNNSARDGKNSASHYIDFIVLPRVGEIVIIHGVGTGFITTSVTHEVIDGLSRPIVVLERWDDQPERRKILQEHGWSSANSMEYPEFKPTAFEVERITIDN